MNRNPRNQALQGFGILLNFYGYSIYGIMKRDKTDARIAKLLFKSIKIPINIKKLIVLDCNTEGCRREACWDFLEVDRE